MTNLLIFAILTLCIVVSLSSKLVRDYCVIGAGPGGCQMGYLLERAGRDYIMFERGSVAGNFYTKYPIHRTLISINKRNTGKTNKEFNMRHDWNSLLTDDESLQMRHYSKEMFPSADVLVRYLKDFVTKLNLKVQFNTDIKSVRKEGNKQSGLFVLKDQNDTEYKCKDLIVSTGIWKENLNRTFHGMEYTENYADISTNKEDYEGQSVLIIGRGNSAFETADSMMSATNLIHIAGRTRLRLAWATHYVGDLRAINNGLLDTYQLKSLDGLIDGDIQNAQVVKKGNKLYVKNFRATPSDEKSTSQQSQTEKLNKMTTMDNYVIREPYDRIIRCLGFKFDFSIFDEVTRPQAGEGKKHKYPAIKPNYESTTVQRMYFAGTNTHSLDWRKSAGGFIHGFRYTTRSLHRVLEWKNHRVVWPHVTVPQVEIINVLLKRINEASGLYQMYSVLSDVIIFRDNGMAEYYEELPLKLIPEFEKHTGSPAGPMVVFDLEYGKNFSGAGKDVFRPGLSVENPAMAHHCGFLHPVIYFYKEPLKALTENGQMPRPDRLHHVVEDFLTLWTANNAHFRPLRRFMENVLQTDLKLYFAKSCFKLVMTHNTVPKSCQEHYLKGQILQSSRILDEVKPY